MSSDGVLPRVHHVLPSEPYTCGLADGVDVVGRAHPGAQQQVADDAAVELLQLRLRAAAPLRDVAGLRGQPRGQQPLVLLDELTCGPGEVCEMTGTTTKGLVYNRPIQVLVSSKKETNKRKTNSMTACGEN